MVLVNSNPATIMTDLEMADHIYMEPLTLNALTGILEQERPQGGLLPTLGGQVGGLNLAKELYRAGVLERLDITLLGISMETIEKAEDREQLNGLWPRSMSRSLPAWWWITSKMRPRLLPK